ncbi:MAG: transcriptional regulator [Ruminococcaceae bacterium]|nr:transcriptional regulator [Oscillospiraceae bacterium]
MKLILAIVGKDDSMALVPELIKEGVSATILSTTGGFLKVGNSTMMIVAEEEKIDAVMDIFAKFCPKRKKVSSRGLARYADVSKAEEVTVGGATLFILNVEKIEKV